jgi:beta-glucosidase
MAVNAPGFKGGDRTNIELPDIQRQLLAALKKAGKKVVFINFSGSAIGLVPESLNCDAILQAWYPGQAGGTAIADVLTGSYNPSGRLPITFYKNVEQLPDFQDYSMKGRTYRYLKEKPLFPFGHGLSFTSFAYGKAKIEHNDLIIPVTNRGDRDGEEVVQLYVQRLEDQNGPNKTLRGFKRVFIAAGDTCLVSFPLNEETFNWWDTSTNTVRPMSGQFNLIYGGTSDDQELKSLLFHRE